MSSAFWTDVLINFCPPNQKNRSRAAGNRKSQASDRSISLSMTLNDLDGRDDEILFKCAVRLETMRQGLGVI